MEKYDLKQLLIDYTPFNEQELADKEIMIYALNTFSNAASRNNVFGHFTASAFVINESGTDILLLKHNIFGSWVCPGGHADGEYDLLAVAKREVEEETGLIVNPVNDGKVFSIQIIPIHSHIKNGKHVSPHLHFDVAFLFKAKDEDMNKIRTLPSENSGVKWTNIQETRLNGIDWFQSIFVKFKQKLCEDFLK